MTTYLYLRDVSGLINVYSSGNGFEMADGSVINVTLRSRPSLPKEYGIIGGPILEIKVPTMKFTPLIQEGYFKDLGPCTKTGRNQYLFCGVRHTVPVLHHSAISIFDLGDDYEGDSALPSAEDDADPFLSDEEEAYKEEMERLTAEYSERIMELDRQIRYEQEDGEAFVANSLRLERQALKNELATKTNELKNQYGMD